MKRYADIFATSNNIFQIMRIEKVINRIQELLLWLYIAAVFAGCIYAVCA